ncbi:MAG: hypothetical protein HFI33_05810 [Lachnospiraceae bacterium]|nr:hypothetical protein [Lachnospiraceae bacterium]
MQTIEDDIKEIFGKQLHLLNAYPELIYKRNNALNGYVVYQTGVSNELHVYNPNECLLDAYNEYKEEARNVCDKYKAEHVAVGERNRCSIQPEKADQHTPFLEPWKMAFFAEGVLEKLQMLFSRLSCIMEK